MRSRFGSELVPSRIGLSLLLGLIVGIWAPASADVENDVAQIRQEFARWESENHQVESHTREFDSGPGELKLTLRRHQGQLRGAVLEVAGEHGWAQESYYFREGGIFFILLEMAEIPLRGPEKFREVRLYVRDGEIIRALKKQFQGVSPGDIRKARDAAKNHPISVTEDWGGRILLKGHALAGLQRDSLARLEEIDLAGHWFFPFE